MAGPPTTRSVRHRLRARFRLLSPRLLAHRQVRRADQAGFAETADVGGEGLGTGGADDEAFLDAVRAAGDAMRIFPASATQRDFTRVDPTAARVLERSAVARQEPKAGVHALRMPTQSPADGGVEGAGTVWRIHDNL